jgi:hypothetical protein
VLFAARKASHFMKQTAILGDSYVAPAFEWDAAFGLLK